MGKPVILLGFANDDDDFLPNLEKEREGIRDALWSHDSDGIIEVKWEIGMTIDKVFSYFKAERYKALIKVFHYGGHANAKVWKLEDSPATITGMASFFENVDLVFLNGCATWDQAEVFMKHGVKAVIASRSDIPDRASRIFAIEFYRNLSEGKTLQTAFDNAWNRIHTELGDGVSRKRTLFWKKNETLENQVDPKSYWELILGNDEMKNWTLAKAGQFDPSYLQLEKEEKSKKDIEFRLMRFGNFGTCRNHMFDTFKSTNQVPAAALIVSGKADNGQKWIAGNLLRDVVPFLGENNVAPLNVTFGIENQNPLLFWQEAREWLGADRDAASSDLSNEIKFLAPRLVDLLQKQPIVFRIYNTLGEESFSEIASALITDFWKPFQAGLSKALISRPEIHIYPFILLIVDEAKELKFEHFHSDESSIHILPKNPPITPAEIKKWTDWETQWEKDNNITFANGMSSMVKALPADYFTNDIVGKFIKRICNELEYRVEDNFSDENRLIHLIKNKKIEYKPDPSLADFF